MATLVPFIPRWSQQQRVAMVKSVYVYVSQRRHTFSHRFEAWRVVGLCTLCVGPLRILRTNGAPTCKFNAERILNDVFSTFSEKRVYYKKCSSRIVAHQFGVDAPADKAHISYVSTHKKEHTALVKKTLPRKEKKDREFPDIKFLVRALASTIGRRPKCALTRNVSVLRLKPIDVMDCCSLVYAF